MWSNFFVQQEDEGRIGVAGAGQGGGMGGMKGFRGQRRTNKMSDSQEGKIKLAFFVSIVGVTLTVLGMGTEFWVELAQPKNFVGNQTCQMAHYGLWKGCIRTLWVSDIDPERTSCGPADLPGESNCTYFKFFTSGENAVIFKKTTNRNLNLAAAILALLSLTMMVMGSICIVMSLSKGVAFFLKPASFCFISSGVLVFLSVLIFHQSVLALLASDHSIPLHHELSWSVACVGSAGTILIFGGFLFILLSLPFSPWQKCWPHKNSTT
ncbi:voltage-dependent calcium channel gamma-6 subunit-like [Oryzias latipes]|uniref:Calcium channel, voltage-dependent, gamma subunit 6b n=2 Tax=Oryzias latipes TaxID=8090 RepID=A0A3B3IM66_ORYLA|nr:voltage-dependent calcium channel gamma-6 subunit-like [Oryzias latipes]XP_023819958.1 voltage-dependent calcium channel gamma-6 subunit-like [Oryzias latipes]XP_023819959.1 voltage-dependent calcium channel gamma-6 subunit-like [Oryzias latipes]XP_023819961.1 voltage-dependent calcium channel gamma-6 subunit-like [Oryzias latipes]